MDPGGRVGQLTERDFASIYDVLIRLTSIHDVNGRYYVCQLNVSGLRVIYKKPSVAFSIINIYSTLALMKMLSLISTKMLHLTG